MPKRSPTKRIGRPFPCSLPSTTVPGPPQPHDGANGVSAIDPSITNADLSDTIPNHSSTSSNSTTTTTIITTPASAAPSSLGTVHRPNFKTWHPIAVLHAFNVRCSHTAMPDDHEMVQELRHGPLPESLMTEHELRILALDAWWEEKTQSALPLGPLQGPGRNGLPERSGEEGGVAGGGQQGFGQQQQGMGGQDEQAVGAKKGSHCRGGSKGYGVRSR